MSDRWGSPPSGPSGPARRRDNRTTIWVVAGLVLAAVLLRTHRISGFSLLAYAMLIPSVILHEVSHGAVALACGDDTAKRAGRLTLNPVPHIDPFGTIIMPALISLAGYGFFAYAKPVPVNVGRLRHPRNQSVVVALVGPAVNIALAGMAAVALKVFVPTSVKIVAFTTLGPGALPTWAEVVLALGFVNVWLAIFNLLPLPPLDGSAVVERLLPRRLLPGYYRIRPFTMVIPLAVVLLFPSALGHVFNPALERWETFVT